MPGLFQLLQNYYKAGDAGSRKTIESVASGLVRKNKIESNSKSLDWQVGVIWPGKYYIKMSDMDGAVLRSVVFTINEMPKGISADKKEKFCKELNGSF